MKRISVEQAFAWAQAFAVREWRLLLPVAFAFFALPGLLVDLLLPEAMNVLRMWAPIDTAAQGRATLALLAVLVVNLAGWLAIQALALVPGISVGEAIGRALRRLPALAGAMLLVMAALVAVLLIAALAIGATGSGAKGMQTALFALLLVAALLLAPRLCLLGPVLVERAIGPGHALSLAWALGRGVFWRMAGALAAYFLGGLVVETAFGAGMGSAVTLLARAAGGAALAGPINAVLFRALAAVVSLGFQLLIAGLYRQLAAQRG